MKNHLHHITSNSFCWVFPKRVYIKKFGDEEVNGSVYQMFGDIKMDLGYIKNGEKE